MSDNNIDRETILDYVGVRQEDRPFGKVGSYDSGNAPTEQRWDTQQLQEEFDVLAFGAPLVQVRRKSDGVVGTIEFIHSPRIYFDFKPQT